MSIINWPIFEQITKILSLIINAVYNIGASFGISNIVFTIILFVIITKLLFSPLDIIKIKNERTVRWANEEYQKNNGRYGKDAVVFYKTKMVFEKAIINLKYHSSATFSLKMLAVQFPLILIIYHILGHMDDFIESLAKLNAEELTAAYTLWGHDLREKPGWSIMLLLPVMAFAAQTLSSVLMNLIRKEKIHPSILFSNILTLIIGIRFSSYLSIYWTVQTIISTIIAVIMFYVYKKKDKDFFIRKNLSKLNKSRIKRGLTVLSEPIAVPKILKDKEVVENE